jgi:cell division septum initiation protein DivIVA
VYEPNPIRFGTFEKPGFAKGFRTPTREEMLEFQLDDIDVDIHSAKSRIKQNLKENKKLQKKIAALEKKRSELVSKAS